MSGKELFKNNTGPCCAVLLLKVQLAMLASWQLFCSQHASCHSCLHACLSGTAPGIYVAASIEGQAMSMSTSFVPTTLGSKLAEPFTWYIAPPFSAPFPLKVLLLVIPVAAF